MRSAICFADEYLGVVKSDEKWYGFQQERKAFRFSLSSKQRTSENFICIDEFSSLEQGYQNSAICVSES